MKFLKTGLAFVLACALLVGCGKKELSEDEMKNLLKESQTAMTQVESGKIVVDANLTMSGDMLAQSGMDNTEMSINLDMTYKDMKKETIGLSADFGVNVAGVDIGGNLYVKDSAMYMNFLGQKMKTPLDLSALSVVEEPVNIDTSVLKDWAYESKDGLDYISCDVDPAYYEEVLNDVGTSEGMAFNAKQMHITYGINKDKLLTSIAIDIDVDMTSEGQNVAYKGTIQMTWSDHNNIKEITYPDLSGYIESDTGLEDL